MKILIGKDIGELYVGEWFFSYCLDYRLSIKYERGYMKVEMHDILRNENCNLKLICSSDYYISFWMDSSWFSGKLRIFPKIKNKIGIEFFDSTIFFKSRKIVKSSDCKYNIFVKENLYLSKYYGTWRSDDKFVYIKIEPMNNHVSISLYTDVSPSWKKIILEKKHVYDSYYLTDNSIEFITKGNKFNKKQDMKICFFDNRLILSYSRMVEVTQQIKNTSEI